jgi:hypothetical protein
MVKKDYPIVFLDEALAVEGVEDDIIAINRSAAVVKGGRRFSFSALAVVVTAMDTLASATARLRKCHPLLRRRSRTVAVA